jgi:hypothetical protein
MAVPDEQSALRLFTWGWKEVQFANLCMLFRMFDNVHSQKTRNVTLSVVFEILTAVYECIAPHILSANVSEEYIASTFRVEE